MHVYVSRGTGDHRLLVGSNGAKPDCAASAELVAIAGPARTLSSVDRLILLYTASLGAIACKPWLNECGPMLSVIKTRWYFLWYELWYEYSDCFKLPVESAP
jgi:hypothetical protein